MISFPICKINLGLNILAKRKDGFHEINSLMYPVPVKDVLEIVPAEKFNFRSAGLPIPGDHSTNIVVQAYELLKKEFNLDPVSIYLYKNIPMGGGLGGGSANGAEALLLLNKIFVLNLSTDDLQKRAAILGSDCAFFIKSTPQISKGRGELLCDFNLDLSGKFLLLVNDGTHISTAEAYQGISPKTPKHNLENVLSQPIRTWKDDLINDFEYPMLEKYQQLKGIKNELYNLGAEYAAMTGSGSTMFGLFSKPPKMENTFDFKNGFVKLIEL